MPGSTPPHEVSLFGEHGLLVHLADSDAVLALFAELDRVPLPGQRDLVPAAQSLLILIDESIGTAALRDLTGALAGRAASAAAGPPEADAAGATSAVTIDVCYDGPDLEEVARLTGQSRQSVIAAHTGSAWRVGFCGFAPGFAYLVGGDRSLTVPRRDTPRTEVPAGSVGLAGDYSGVYPRASPGGWQLIGRTDATLWDARRDPPAALAPGQAVHFRSVRESMTVSDGRPPPAGSKSGAGRRGVAGRGVAGRGVAGRGGIRVLRSGMQCTVQDLGRFGYARVGVSSSGAADRGAAVRANRLVGNPDAAAVLELLLGNAEFETRANSVLAITGASVEISVMGGSSDAAPPRMDEAFALPAGARLRLGRPRRGLRTYIAVGGGAGVAPVLGSRSTDTLAGLGPPVVQDGDWIAVGAGAPTVGEPGPAPDTREPRPVPDAREPRPAPDTREPSSGPAADDRLPILPGPQTAEYPPGLLDRIATAKWTVSPASNRVAVRLTTANVADVLTPGQTEPSESLAATMPSQPLVRGAIQVPPSGELVVFLADVPVTGGYPVVAVVADSGVDRLAQARPGSTLGFRC